MKKPKVKPKKPVWMENLSKQRAALVSRARGGHTNGPVKHRPERMPQDNGVFPKPTAAQLAEARRKRVLLPEPDWLADLRRRMAGI